MGEVCSQSRTCCRALGNPDSPRNPDFAAGAYCLGNCQGTGNPIEIPTAKNARGAEGAAGFLWFPGTAMKAASKMHAAPKAPRGIFGFVGPGDMGSCVPCNGGEHILQNDWEVRRQVQNLRAGIGTDLKPCPRVAACLCPRAGSPRAHQHAHGPASATARRRPPKAQHRGGGDGQPRPKFSNVRLCRRDLRPQPG